MFEESTRSLDEIADLQSEGYYLSKKFSLVGDVVIQSTDKVRFRLHKKDLATFSGGFPPVELISETNPSEIVHLSEGAIILDLLFSFARAGRYPDIHTLEIKTLVALADAAEKYEVYSAVMACKILMRVNLERQPLQVFIYAEKYQYTDLLDETAIFVLGTPLLEMFEKISNDLFKAWVGRRGHGAGCGPAEMWGFGLQNG
ncbi:hypothetical protein BDN72DRAFT_861596 [Pluteus cervinus]|uniref:Uncharacterized protein n=1 Tax=Pluteus cervinus TaxID=181527 RepID=A0ACD3AEU6_9AGAR|nr:hypothetical protein BDN72DRAFT_861596 [Pluteus cervinus]